MSRDEEAVTIEPGRMLDRRARFDAEVLPYLDAAYRFARWLAGSSADADDILQESVLRAFRGFEGLRGSDAKAWLLAIVRNCHSTMVSQRGRRLLVPMPEEGDPADGHALVSPATGPEDAALERDAARTLERLMASLPEEHREVLILREIEELDYRDIARVIDVPIGTVMSRLARARAALKARWLKEPEEVGHAVR
jgi:RNA polymerase sigma factor (sigma-70 family)